jgi:hypothetical protein
MKNTLRQIIWGKDKRFNGLIALGIVTLIVLGCNCNKLAELGQKDTNSTTPTNTFTPTNTTAPTPSSPTYTKADASKKQIPSDAEMQDMIKTTLLDFNSAVQSEDFTAFHAKSSKALQKTANPAKMKQTFQLFIDGEMDISSISSMTTTITTPAKLESRSGYNIISVAGKYPTYGVETTYDLQYVGEGKDWKLLLIKVYAPIKRK